jgi:carboxyl-terminal processing protease
VVEQDLPEELKAAAKASQPRGEASLRGHLKNNDGESTGSSSFVPKEKEKDTQLKYALDFLRGLKTDEQKKVEIPQEQSKTAN